MDWNTAIYGTKTYAERNEEKKQAELGLLEKEISLAVATARRAAQDADQQMKNDLRQAYIESRLSERDQPQLHAAQGLGGGYSESARKANQNAYEEAQRQATQKHQQALQDVETNVADIEAKGALQKEEIINRYAQLLADWAYNQQIVRH